MEDFETIECDVLVVGAGGAGLRAAIAASEYGANVALVSKSLLGKAHTVMAEGGVLYQGTFDEVKSNEDVIEAYLGRGLKQKNNLNS